MAKFDLKSKVDVVDTFLPVARTASGTGSAVDLRGYESAAAYVSVGAKAGGTITPSLEDSADGTTYAAVGTGDLDGAFAAITAGTSTQFASATSVTIVTCAASSRRRAARWTPAS
jgi:hypothetical protein